MTKNEFTMMDDLARLLGISSPISQEERNTSISYKMLTLRKAKEVIVKLGSDLSKEVDSRDYWEEKATELANDIGEALGFEVGEHSSSNCPVQKAIDGVYEMGSQIDKWKET